MKTPSFTSVALAACAAFALQGAGAAQPMSDAQARYQQERANCLSGNTQEDRATCLREAGAALVEARRGGLTDPQGRERQQNATDRCKVLSGDERSDCYARMRGEGTTSGSVEGGGILREKITIEPVLQGGNATPMPGGAAPMPSGGSTTDSTRQ
jgi:hypothetical protein